jgi:uncharacterized protein YeaO (DUF488 family)
VGRCIGLRHAAAEPSSADGVRVLIDRRWPAGLRKEEVGVDLWLKDLGPSATLTRWYGRDPRRWPAFAQRYRAELMEHRDLVLLLCELWDRGPLTLLHSNRDPERCAAAVVREMMEERVLAARSLQ